ncbi:MAG: hypothetical protein HYV97_12455 [Bdellovibrio sp.]|nr:hypothetical protein [Bdellovibrio sp.]
MWKCSYRCLIFIFIFFSGLIALPSICGGTSRHLILITHWQQSGRALLIKQKLIDEIGIPDKAIDLIERFNPCQKNFDALYFLCVVDGEDMFKIVISQQELFREAFGHLLSVRSVQKKEAL